MSLKEQFEAAAVNIKTLTKRPSNDELLQLYAFHKQASVGDVNIPKPGMFDFVAKAKYDAWKKMSGTSSEDAMQKYVDLVNQLLEKYK